MSFSTVLSLDFYIFLAISKTSKKSNTYISGEAVHSQTAGHRDDQTDKNQTFHRTTTLQADPVNQADKDCFDPNLSIDASSPTFLENS